MRGIMNVKKKLKSMAKWLIACGLVVMCPGLAQGQDATSSATPARTSYEADLPMAISNEVWQSSIPKDIPFTYLTVALGKKLFFDTRLSKDGSVSCATCHDPEMAFTDGKAVSEGIHGQKGTRSAPTILNAMFSSTQFWDGRVKTLEEQARLPLINPIEMGMDSHEAVVIKLKRLTDYDGMFQEVFNGQPTIDRIVQAIATFERTQLSGSSSFDQFFRGDSSAISKRAQRGWDLFRGKALCQTCHTFDPDTSPFFTDFQFHNIGIGARRIKDFDSMAKRIRKYTEKKAIPDQLLDALALSDNTLAELGRFNVTRKPSDLGAFKTPTLRDVELTAPYMHDGSLTTLKEVMDFYNKGGHANVYLDKRIRALGLNDQEIEDLIAFMKSLTSDRVRRLAIISHGR